MNWFKHDSNASTDAKVKKLILKYGAEGYAIYFHCIELIVSDITENNITFELEHDSEIVADNLKIKGTSDQSGQDRVNEIMKYIVTLGLFEDNQGNISCYKILKRLDSSMTSNIKMRKMIVSGKESHDNVMISHDNVMQEEKRRDKKRREEIDKKKKYGEYKHVLLTDDEYLSLKDKVTNREELIKRLDEYIETSGKSYKNHSLVMQNWNKKDKPEKNDDVFIDDDYDPTGRKAREKANAI